MSHIVTIKTELRDRNGIVAACRRLKLDAPIDGIHQLFDGKYSGLGIKLPGWQYPIVADCATGGVKYDNYGGLWGEQAQFDLFLSTYAAEKAKIEARKKGYQLTSETIATDGTIRLVFSDPQ